MSNERIAMVSAMYHNEGLTLAEIGKQIGVSPSRVQRILDEADFPKVVEIAALHREGLEPAEIAERLGMRAGRVESLLAKLSTDTADAESRDSVAKLLGDVAKKRRNDEIVEVYYDSTLTMAEVGARFGITGARVGQIINRANKRQVEAVSALYNAGLTPEGVAARLGMPVRRVRAICDRVEEEGVGEDKLKQIASHLDAIKAILGDGWSGPTLFVSRKQRWRRSSDLLMTGEAPQKVLQAMSDYITGGIINGSLWRLSTGDDAAPARE